MAKYKEIVVPNVINKKDNGYLYYVDKEGNVCRSPKVWKMRQEVGDVD